MNPSEAIKLAMAALETVHGKKLVLNKTRSKASPASDKNEDAAKAAEAWNVLNHLSKIV